MNSEDDIYNDRLCEGLPGELVDLALKVVRFLRGLMLVTGLPGSGKGLFANPLAWIIKSCFEGRKALLDYKQRPPFVLYLPFTEEFLANDIYKIADMSEIPTEIDRGDKDKIKQVSKVAEDWVKSERGEVYLRNSVLVLEEFKRYMHNRRPHNPMGITIGHIITWWRHLDILIIGMTPFKREIDAISCLPYVTHEVRCAWTPESKALCRVFQTQWISSKGVLNTVGKPRAIEVDGWKERPELGVRGVDDGVVHYYRYFDIYNSKFMPSMKPTSSRVSL